MLSESFLEAIREIDEANSADPNSEIWDGAEHPKELLYGQRMSAWLETMYPDASEVLRLAARAQHICRWEVPRSDYPMDRAGYHKWRTGLYTYHGDKLAEILEKSGYGQSAIDQAKAILSKRKLRSDPDTQALEDAACLVFLQYHFLDFIRRDDVTQEKAVDIVQKTWAKMTGRGHEAALGLDLPEEASAIVKAALA